MQFGPQCKMMLDTIKSENVGYDKGYIAAMSGEPKTNPYDIMLALSDCWFEGYEAGRVDAEEVILHALATVSGDRTANDIVRALRIAGFEIKPIRND